eukprot:1115686_1
MITHKRDGSGQCTNAVQKIDKLIKINTKLQQQTESMQSQSQSTQRESMQWVFCTFWCCFALSLSLIYRPNCVIIVQIFSPSGAPYNKTYPHNTFKLFALATLRRIFEVSVTPLLGSPSIISI